MAVARVRREHERRRRVQRERSHEREQAMQCALREALSTAARVPRSDASCTHDSVPLRREERARE
jgi:hypothetical protein